MSPVVIVLVGLVIATYVAFVSRSPEPDPGQAAETEAAWQRAFASNDSLFGAGMMKMAKPLSQTRYIAAQAKHPAWEQLRDKVVASGLYGGSMDVFLAYQGAAGLVAVCLCIVAIGSSGSGLLRLGLALMAVALLLLPYNKVSTAIKRRTEEVNRALPEFVELLLMPLNAGQSIIPSLEFTSQFTDGAVREEVLWLLASRLNPEHGEEHFFREAGRRLGTPEAIAFFSALGQAHIEGVRVSEALMRQAEGLRILAYQARRAQVKQIPVRLIITFAVHFLPLLFIMTFIPLMYSLQNI